MFKKWKDEILIALLASTVIWFAANRGFKNKDIKQEKQKQVIELSHSEFLEKIDKNDIKELTIKGGIVQGLLKEGKTADGKKAEPKKFIAKVLLHEKILEKIEKKGIPTKLEEVKRGPFENINIFKIFDVLGTLLWITVLVMMYRNMRGGIEKFGIPMSSSNTKMFNPSLQNVKFTDVLGIDEAKKDVSEIVDFLSDPERYSRLGAKIPKGVLMVGPPGTGKTLLAKAIAGEAGVPFFTTSGSEFVEMFVGVGASRVRALFDEAKKSAPCLIFIDEIDAVGRHRGSGYGGGNDEREQTLNQLLVEMDGFEGNKGIVVIAATNREDVLDNALLRPGRFDRKVYIDMPDLKGREAILAKYLKDVKILSNVDPLTIARGTPGFSGADLANLVNEAALITARLNKKCITKEDFEYARDKILMGAEKKSTTMTDAEIKNTAYHEAGHALCSVLLPGVDPIHKATIVPRGRSLGLVQTLPEHDKVSVSITEIKSNIAVAMAGRICEELFFGAENATTGASSDIEYATNYARGAVTKWGFSKVVGHVCYKHNDEYDISETTKREIDMEVKSMLEDGYTLALTTIKKNKDKVEKIAKALLEFETLTGDEIRGIVDGKDLERKPETREVKVAFERKSTLPIMEYIEVQEIKNSDKNAVVNQLLNGKDAIINMDGIEMVDTNDPLNSPTKLIIGSDTINVSPYPVIDNLKDSKPVLIIKLKKDQNLSKDTDDKNEKSSDEKDVKKDDEVKESKSKTSSKEKPKKSTKTKISKDKKDDEK